MKDTLGDRIKSQYEDRTRFFLPRRTYTVIRVDGKAFHTLTKGCQKPFDQFLMGAMDKTAQKMCKEIQGAVLAYVQSDEISILVTDFDKITTNAWFDGNIQKMCSIAASTATLAFNQAIASNGPLASKVAMFDARVFTIPDRTEVENYFIWRQQDATRNSLQMVARSLYSHKELDNKNQADLHNMLHAKGINWNNHTSGEKRGRCIIKKAMEVADKSPVIGDKAPSPESVIRNQWVSLCGREGGYGETPVFTQDRTFLKSLIPVIGVEK